MSETVVVVISSEPRVFSALSSALKRRGYLPVLARTALEGLTKLEEGGASLAVIALPLPDSSGRAVIERARELGIGVIVSGTDDEVRTSVDALDLGAQDHLDDPIEDTAEFLAVVGLALGSRRGDAHLRYLREKEAPGQGWQAVIGESAALQRVVGILTQVCRRTSGGSTPTILLRGETGSGKGYVAKCVHYNSGRRNQPFVEVNCAALPPSLIESELFGSERGAFTDSKATRPGLFETASGGTLFLDEIGAVPPDLQAKLLTAIEEKTVRRIGGRQPQRVDVQIIAATHDNLEEKVDEGTFRGDLFHRLNVVAVTLPPLRERGEDIVLLAEAFVRAICREYGMPPRRITEDAKEWMLNYAWPGNVRELRNQIERIVLLENDSVIRASHFQAARFDRSVDVSLGPGGLHVRLPDEGVPLAVLEREVLREALSRCDGNVSRASRYLSITRQTLIYRMKKYGLTIASDAPSGTMRRADPIGTPPKRASG